MFSHLDPLVFTPAQIQKHVFEMPASHQVPYPKMNPGFAQITSSVKLYPLCCNHGISETQEGCSLGLECNATVGDIKSFRGPNELIISLCRILYHKML